MTAARPGSGFLNALGLHRRELRAWAMYDFAISSFQTTISNAVFPIFFVKVAAGHLTPPQASQWWGNANTIGAILIAVLAPFLGAIADYRAAKKKFLARLARTLGLKSACPISAPIKSPSLASGPSISGRMASAPSGRLNVGPMESMSLTKPLRGAQSTITVLCQRKFRN